MSVSHAVWDSLLFVRDSESGWHEYAGVSARVRETFEIRSVGKTVLDDDTVVEIIARASSFEGKDSIITGLYAGPLDSNVVIKGNSVVMYGRVLTGLGGTSWMKIDYIEGHELFLSELSYLGLNSIQILIALVIGSMLSFWFLFRRLRRNE